VAEELVDLVDSEGISHIFGIPRSEVKLRKEEFLAQGLYQPIVIVVVADDEDRIVAQVRGKAKGDDGSDEVDLVCGVISSGEDWETAARREAREEIGVELSQLTFVEQRVNVYQRHRTLAVARPVGEPFAVDKDEVASVFAASLDELRDLESTDTSFVNGFFGDVELALAKIQEQNA